MLGAIYIGLSGMDAYSKGLQIISNNVANLNTPGFKATNVSFSDLFDGTGGGGLTYLGSSFSPRGGEGVEVGSSLLDFGQGDLQQTDNDLDLALQGSGFLTLLTPDGQTLYTRTGSFAVDKSGFISEQSTGYHLAVLDASGKPVAVNVDDKQTNPAVATTTIAFAGNISTGGGTTVPTVSSIPVFDSLGNKALWDVTFTADATQPDTWDVAVTDDTTKAQVGTGTLQYDGSGIITSDPATISVTTTIAGSTASVTVSLDFSQGVTSQSTGSTSTIATTSVDGNAAGDLSTVTVDTTGQILLTYSNTKTVQQGAVAIADFRDPQDLVQESNGLFRNNGTGQMRYLASGTEGIGTLESKQLEASNVDLSAEFGDLILVQRGFQACSQVVSVANDMIQQLFGIRGQG
jgi:flagellar hook protein FlgE